MTVMAILPEAEAERGVVVLWHSPTAEELPLKLKNVSLGLESNLPLPVQSDCVRHLHQQ